MKVGAVLVTSISLVEEIILKKIQAKNILKSFIRSNKYIGSKDRKLLYEITFNMLKKYYGLFSICKIYDINCSIRNLALFNFCNKFKHYNLEDLYQGKYSLKKKEDDFYIFNKAINFGGARVITISLFRGGIGSAFRIFFIRRKLPYRNKCQNGCTKKHKIAAKVSNR